MKRHKSRIYDISPWRSKDRLDDFEGDEFFHTFISWTFCDEGS
jgi:hypothetical protein